MVINMDAGAISSYTDFIKSQNTADAKLKEKIDGADYANASDKELMDVCKQFESYFLEQVFKEMQKTVDCFKSEESSSSSSGLVDYFKDNAIQELAGTSTELQGLGLAQMMYEQMKRNYGIGVVQPEELLEE